MSEQMENQTEDYKLKDLDGARIEGRTLKSNGDPWSLGYSPDGRPLPDELLPILHEEGLQGNKSYKVSFPSKTDPASATKRYPVDMKHFEGSLYLSEGAKKLGMFQGSLAPGLSRDFKSDILDKGLMAALSSVMYSIPNTIELSGKYSLQKVLMQFWEVLGVNADNADASALKALEGPDGLIPGSSLKPYIKAKVDAVLGAYRDELKPSSMQNFKGGILRRWLPGYRLKDLYEVSKGKPLDYSSALAATTAFTPEGSKSSTVGAVGQEDAVVSQQIAELSKNRQSIADKLVEIMVDIDDASSYDLDKLVKEFPKVIGLPMAPGYLLDLSKHANERMSHRIVTGQYLKTILYKQIQEIMSWLSSIGKKKAGLTRDEEKSVDFFANRWLGEGASNTDGFTPGDWGTGLAGISTGTLQHTLSSALPAIREAMSGLEKDTASHSAYNIKEILDDRHGFRKVVGRPLTLEEKSSLRPLADVMGRISGRALSDWLAVALSGTLSDVGRSLKAMSAGKRLSPEEEDKLTNMLQHWLPAAHPGHIGSADFSASIGGTVKPPYVFKPEDLGRAGARVSDETAAFKSAMASGDITSVLSFIRSHAGTPMAYKAVRALDARVILRNPVVLESLSPEDAAEWLVQDLSKSEDSVLRKDPCVLLRFPDKVKSKFLDDHTEVLRPFLKKYLEDASAGKLRISGDGRGRLPPSTFVEGFVLNKAREAQLSSIPEVRQIKAERNYRIGL